jgi:hypothetical protein
MVPTYIGASTMTKTVEIADMIGREVIVEATYEAVVGVLESYNPETGEAIINDSGRRLRCFDWRVDIYLAD